MDPNHPTRRDVLALAVATPALLAASGSSIASAAPIPGQVEARETLTLSAEPDVFTLPVNCSYQNLAQGTDAGPFVRLFTNIAGCMWTVWPKEAIGRLKVGSDGTATGILLARQGGLDAIWPHAMPNRSEEMDVTITVTAPDGQTARRVFTVR